MNFLEFKEIDKFRDFFYYNNKNDKARFYINLSFTVEGLIETTLKNKLKKCDYIKVLENISEVIIETSNELEFEEILSSIEIELIRLYMEEGLYDDCIRVAQHLNLLSYDPKDKAYAFVSLIEASIAIGDSELEKKLISNLHTVRNLVGFENIWFYLSRYFSKTDAKESLEFIDKLLNATNLSNDYDLKFKLSGQVLANYFYLGYTKKALKLSEEIKIDYKKYLDENEIARVYLEHYIVILMHNVDKNQYVVDGNLYVKEGYRKLNDKYNYLMTCVNLGDGYMGIGQLEKAEEELEDAIIETENAIGINAHSTAAICYANALSSRGKNIIALYYYEIGIKESNKIQHFWDVYYGQIWRMLTLSEMGEHSAIETLFNVRNECKEKCFEYLIDLATCFILISVYNLKYDFSEEEAKKLLESVDGDKVPGLKAQINAVYVLIYNPKDDILIELLNEMIKYTLQCEGIKGRSQLISFTIEKYKNYIDSGILSNINNWIKKYVEPILKDIEEIEELLFHEFDGNPNISSCNFDECSGMCCYDGVYVDKDEENEIKSFIKRNMSLFSHLPRKKFANGNWKEVVKGRKTAVRKHEFDVENYPGHFNKTICVFADSNGFCTLQKVATKLDLHPWKYKPKACWMLPITILKDGEIISPPKKDEKDPCYYDESYPGYTKFLPCVKYNTNGQSWYKVYKQEILWGRFLLEFENDED